MSHRLSSLVAFMFWRSLPECSCLSCSILPILAAQPAPLLPFGDIGWCTSDSSSSSILCRLRLRAAICRSISGPACGDACHVSRDASPVQSSANSTKPPSILCTGDCIPRLSYYDAHIHLPVPPLQALQVSLPAARGACRCAQCKYFRCSAPSRAHAPTRVLPEYVYD